MAKKGKGKNIGFFGAISSLLGSIPAVRSAKKAAGKAFKKQIKKAKNKNKLKNLLKKLRKKRKKKRGKFFTKARKLRNRLSRRKLVRKFKRAVKKAVLTVKKATVKQGTKKASNATKAAVKQVKKNETAQNLKLVSMGLNYIPVFGNIKALYEMATGKDMITGQKVENPRARYTNLKNSCPAPKTYSVHDGEPKTTLTDLRKVLSTPSTVYPDGLAPFTVMGANLAYALLLEDIATYANPNATAGERNGAALSILNPIGKAGKVKKGAEAFKDMGKGIEAAHDLANNANKVQKTQYTQKEIEQLGEYSKKQLDKGNSNDAYGGYYQRKEQRTDDYNNKTGDWKPAKKTTPPDGPYRTDKEADVGAEILGYKRVPGVKSHGRAVYTNGKEYISPDTPRKTTGSTDNGGVWKKANSPEDLFRKETRKGTYDKNLNRIGD
ncbi:toxin C-terminal domain-containing protein [Lysinibacillus sp. NPDC093688]|uniref:toxin C-terminal domain-containing protein n=1 Tax=Lysinibacillus sp. NPDC093688 TaxID=3390577 RepID=UPI003D0931DE